MATASPVNLAVCTGLLVSIVLVINTVRGAGPKLQQFLTDQAQEWTGGQRAAPGGYASWRGVGKAE